jgi:hypothetical protein
MLIWKRGGARGSVIVALAGALWAFSATSAFAGLTIEHESSTLTQSIGGHGNAGYFHGPAGAFTTVIGTEQYFTPWIDPVGGNPANPTDLNGSYPLSITGMPLPPGNNSTPIAFAGADAGAISNGPGFDLGATVQSTAIAAFDFASGDATVAEADIKVVSILTYSAKMTVDTAPYNFHAEGSFGIFTDPVDGNANTSITSATQIASATMQIAITDGGTTFYNFDDVNHPAFVMPDLVLGVGATITVTFVATTEAGFITTASRENLVGGVETVNVQRYSLATPYISIVPEPASLGILTIGAAGLAIRRRRK